MSEGISSAGSVVEELNFEEAFSELQGTVQRLEEGDLTLEAAISLYERGMALARRCTDALDAAELQVQKLEVANNQPQLDLRFQGDDD